MYNDWIKMLAIGSKKSKIDIQNPAIELLVSVRTQSHETMKLAITSE